MSMRGKRSALTLAVLVAIGLLATAASAGATITPDRDPATAIAAAADPRLVLGTVPPFPNIPPNGNPVGVGTGSVLPFPITPPSYLVLSTGDAAQADLADQDGVFASAGDGGGLVTTPINRGDTALDVTILQVPFTAPTVPAGFVNCLGFDFRFLSEEYPEFIDSPFNDAFIAELDSTTWTTSGSEISAPNNFALDGNRPVTIKSSGPKSMSPAEAAGTPYGGATAPLHAQSAVSTPGTHNLYLSIFDQQDDIYDTAVFLDNLTLTTVPVGGCPSGSTALGPALAITGPASGATVNTSTPTLTGTAGDAAGDAPTVTVRIYSGNVAAGAPVQTLSAPRSGTSWSVVTAALDPGVYTAQATQANGQGINGLSGPLTFTVIPALQQPSLVPPTQSPPPPPAPPVPGKSVVARVVSGQVFIKLPAGKRARAVTPGKGFVPFTGAANIPVGSQLDTANGRVALTSAADTGGVKTQTADFYQGIFEIKQAVPKKKPKKPKALITDLVLKGASASQCAPLKGARAAAANKKKGPKSVLSKLWGNGKGKFRTAGKYSSATVRGTIWLTQDECDGTLTKVTRGIVSVRDFKRNKTVTVKAGHSYLARAQRAASKAKRR
jgi:hypothetical protein